MLMVLAALNKWRFGPALAEGDQPAGRTFRAHGDHRIRVDGRGVGGYRGDDDVLFTGMRAARDCMID